MTMQKPPMVKDSDVTLAYSEAAGLKWHYAEMGAGTPVVLLHGIPESWYCWRYQMEPFAKHFRVIAPDMKGYGLSDKSDGDYSIMNIAKETVAFLDSIGVDKFHLAGHDWGAGVSLAIAALFPDRVISYCHMSTPTLRYDVTVAPHHNIYTHDPSKAVEAISNPREYVKWWWETGGHKGGIEALTPAEWDRAAAEMAHEGLAEAVSRYFRDQKAQMTDGEGPASQALAMVKSPTRFIYPDSDPRQPLDYVLPGLGEHVPGFKAIVVISGSGHFSMQEQPEQVNRAMLSFYLEHEG